MKDPYGNVPIEGKSKLYLTQDEYEKFMRLAFGGRDTSQENYFKVVKSMFGLMAFELLNGHDLQTLVVPEVTIRVEIVAGKKVVQRLFEGKINAQTE